MKSLLVIYFALTTLIAFNNVSAESDSNGVKLCTCSTTEKCIVDAYKTIDECKNQCAHRLSGYTNKDAAETDSNKLASCFESPKVEPAKVSTCMGDKIENMCSRRSNLSDGSLIEKPDYSSFYEPIVEFDAKNDSIRTSPLIRRARQAFSAFQSFVKCVTNCAKKRAIACIDENKCAVHFPASQDVPNKPKSLGAREVFHQCSSFDVKKTLRNGCQCLVRKKKIKELVGLCPFFMNTFLMREL